MKVKELKQLLENVDDELDIVGLQHGLEKSGLLPVSTYGMGTVTGEIVSRQTRDAFDGTEYSYDVFVAKKDGNTKMFRLY